MSPATEKDLREEITRLEGELAKTQKIQNELWSHDIYVNAQKKMTASVVILVTLIGVVGAGTMYEWGKRAINSAIDRVSNTIIAEAETEMKKEVEKKVNLAINTMVADEREKMRESLEGEVAALEKEMAAMSGNMTTQLKEAKETVDREISGLRAEAEKAALTAGNAYSERVEQIRIGVAQSEKDTVTEMKLTKPSNNRTRKSTDCNPLELTDEQIDMISIRQEVTETNTYAKAGNAKLKYYQNTFSVAARKGDKTEVSSEIAKCVINSIDRVVYNLDESWFNPSEIVRINPKDNFRYSAKVYGFSEILANIYLKGRLHPLKQKGNFFPSEIAPRYFEKQPTAVASK